MAAAKSTAKNSPALLRQVATALPEVTEGITCDKAAYKAGGKAFLFVGTGDAEATIMLKLQASLPEAKKLAAVHPAIYKIGGQNWVTITLPNNERPRIDLLTRWIEESYRLLAPKRLVADLIVELRSKRTPKFTRVQSYPLTATVTATGEGGRMTWKSPWKARLADGTVVRLAIHARVKTMKIPTLQVGQVVRVAQHPHDPSTCSVSTTDVVWVSPSKLARLAKKARR